MHNTIMNRRPLIVFYLLFTLSGFSGLIYESIWSHYLKLFLGHAAYAQSLVLAIFMGGMALGAFITSRFSLRWKNLLKGYAITEGIIGVCALFFHSFFDFVVNASYVSVFPLLQSPAVVNAYKWSLSSLIILPQSILLGMTFPLMTSGILRIFSDKPGKTISLLYFTNSIGAAAGVLVSGFLLINWIGLPGTIMFAGAINIILAFLVLKLIQGYGMPALPEPMTPGEGASRGDRFYLLLLAASLFTGLASFIYEIGWIRMLSLVLGSSTHAFELMLSAFILGLAFGGLWIQKRIDTLSRPISYLVMVQIAMGICALLSLPLYGSTFKVMQVLVKSLPKTDGGYFLFNLSSHAIAMAVMLPATFCAGMTLPLITFLLLKNGYGERSIGAVYAANTIGAIIGVFFAIHLGMPLLGLKGLLVTGSVVDIGLGLILLWVLAEKYESKKISVILTGAGVGAVLVVAFFIRLDYSKMASGVYRTGDFLGDDEIVRYYKDGKTASVSVTYNTTNDLLIIRTNGKSDASIKLTGEDTISDNTTQVLSAFLPMMYYPEAKNVAVIGIGSGATTSALLLNPRLTHVDTVEIEEKMVEGARYFGDHVSSAFSDSRSRIFIEDAKTFFSSHNKKYDVIVSAPSNPWVSGVASLFTGEFYEMAKRHLNREGLFVQWIHLAASNPHLVASVMKAIQMHFDDFVVYNTNDLDIIIVSKPYGSIGTPDWGVLESGGIRSVLARLGIKGIQDVDVRYVGSKKILENYAASYNIRPNSDYYPVLDQNAVKARFLMTNAYDIISYYFEKIPAIELLSKSRSSDETTHLSPSVFTKTRLILNALHFRNYLVRGDFGVSMEGMSADDMDQFAETRKAFFDCGGQRHPRRTEYLVTVLKNTVPFLKPGESDSLLDFLMARPCYSSLTQTEKNWLSLFRAIGRRDAQQMVKTATAFLGEQEKMTKKDLQYAVAVAMLGNLSMGQKEAALQIWNQFRPILYTYEKPPIIFAFLLSNTL